MIDRTAQRLALLRFGAQSVTPVGVGYLGNDGRIIADQGCQLWLHARFTHIMSCEALMGSPASPQARRYATWAIDRLATTCADHDHGGWFSHINLDGVATSPRKEAYAHAFVMLAASSAHIAGIDGADELLAHACDVFNRYFWNADAHKATESYANDWSDLEAYRGLNANMHTVEAFLAVYDATGDVTYLHRAAALASFVADLARSYSWRLPEHFDPTWRVDMDYHRDQPAHPFRPWGATVGHGFEWARLIGQVALNLQELESNHTGFPSDVDVASIPDPAELIDVASHLYQQARSDGWDNPGFVYTTDFSGTPIVTQRMHWVICEALNAAYLATRICQGDFGTHLANRDKVPSYEADIATWWDFVGRYQLESPGRWHHELDRHNRPSQTTWIGKPDIYHAWQALYFPDSHCQYSCAKSAACDSGLC